MLGSVIILETAGTVAGFRHVEAGGFGRPGSWVDVSCHGFMVSANADDLSESFEAGAIVRCICTLKGKFEITFDKVSLNTIPEADAEDLYYNPRLLFEADFTNVRTYMSKENKLRRSAELVCSSYTMVNNNLSVEDYNLILRLKNSRRKCIASPVLNRSRKLQSDGTIREGISISFENIKMVAPKK